jgi:hypothetical protein
VLDKTVDQNKRLELARAGLEVAESALILLAGSKAAAASGGVEAYALWRADNEAKAAERERLTIMIDSIERELSEASTADADAEFRKRHAAQGSANAKLAGRTNADLAKVASIILTLARDHAEAALEDRRINQLLPDDLAPLVSADFLARGAPALPREVIRSERVWLWTFADSGALVGDQDSVNDLGDGRGVIPPPEGLAAVTDGRTLRKKNCVRSLFDQITMHPEQSAERLTPLWQMRLVDPNGPRVLFDGAEIFQPAEALAALNRASAGMAPKERPIEVELRPVQPVSANADGAR